MCQFLCDCISFLPGLPCFSSRFLSTTIPCIIYQQNDTLLYSLLYINMYYIYHIISIHIQYTCYTCMWWRLCCTRRMHRITYATHSRTYKDRHNFIFYVSCFWIFSFYFTQKKTFQNSWILYINFQGKLIFYHRCRVWWKHSRSHMHTGRQTY